MSETTAPSRRVLYPAYFAAVVFVLLPLGDLVVQAWPFTPGELAWRVGVVGTVGQILTFPTLALVIAVVLSSSMGHTLVLRTLAVLALLASLLAFGMLAVFALDVVQLRATLVPEVQATFTRQMGKSCLNLVLYGLLNGWLGVAGLRASLRPRRSAAKESRKAGILVEPSRVPANSSAS